MKWSPLIVVLIFIFCLFGLLFMFALPNIIPFVNIISWPVYSFLNIVLWLIGGLTLVILAIRS